jgi:hypothetical protein
MYSAPSPYDSEPTRPIDVQTLRAWWLHRSDIPPARREAAYYAPRRGPRTV